MTPSLPTAQAGHRPRRGLGRHSRGSSLVELVSAGALALLLLWLGAKAAQWYSWSQEFSGLSRQKAVEHLLHERSVVFDERLTQLRCTNGFSQSGWLCDAVLSSGKVVAATEVPQPRLLWPVRFVIERLPADSAQGQSHQTAGVFISFSRQHMSPGELGDALAALIPSVQAALAQHPEAVYDPQQARSRLTAYSLSSLPSANEAAWRRLEDSLEP